MSPRFWPAQRTLFTRTECPWGSAGDDRHSGRRDDCYPLGHRHVRTSECRRQAGKTRPEDHALCYRARSLMMHDSASANAFLERRVPTSRLSALLVRGARRSRCSKVAELPELLGCAGVLEQDMVDLERVDIAIAKAIHCVRNVREEFGEVCLVVGRHRLARLLALLVPRHDPRLVVSMSRGRGGRRAQTQAHRRVVEDVRIAA